MRNELQLLLVGFIGFLAGSLPILFLYRRNVKQLKRKNEAFVTATKTAVQDHYQFFVNEEKVSFSLSGIIGGDISSDNFYSYFKIIHKALFCIEEWRGYFSVNGFDSLPKLSGYVKALWLGDDVKPNTSPNEAVFYLGPELQRRNANEVLGGFESFVVRQLLAYLSANGNINIYYNYFRFCEALYDHSVIGNSGLHKTAPKSFEIMQKFANARKAYIGKYLKWSLLLPSSVSNSDVRNWSVFVTSFKHKNSISCVAPEDKEFVLNRLDKSDCVSLMNYLLGKTSDLESKKELLAEEKVMLATFLTLLNQLVDSFIEEKKDPDAPVHSVTSIQPKEKSAPVSSKPISSFKTIETAVSKDDLKVKLPEIVEIFFGNNADGLTKYALSILGSKSIKDSIYFGNGLPAYDENVGKFKVSWDWLSCHSIAVDTRKVAAQIIVASIMSRVPNFKESVHFLLGFAKYHVVDQSGNQLAIAFVSQIQNLLTTVLGSSVSLVGIILKDLSEDKLPFATWKVKPVAVPKVVLDAIGTGTDRIAFEGWSAANNSKSELMLKVFNLVFKALLMLDEVDPKNLGDLGVIKNYLNEVISNCYDDASRKTLHGFTGPLPKVPEEKTQPKLTAGDMPDYTNAKYLYDGYIRYKNGGSSEQLDEVLGVLFEALTGLFSSIGKDFDYEIRNSKPVTEVFNGWMYKAPEQKLHNPVASSDNSPTDLLMLRYPENNKFTEFFNKLVEKMFAGQFEPVKEFRFYINEGVCKFMVFGTAKSDSDIESKLKTTNTVDGYETAKLLNTPSIPSVTVEPEQKSVAAGTGSFDSSSFLSFGNKSSEPEKQLTNPKKEDSKPAPVDPNVDVVNPNTLVASASGSSLLGSFIGYLRAFANNKLK